MPDHLLNRLLIGGFALLISLPMMGHALFGEQQALEAEKRIATAFPPISDIHQPRAWFRDVSNWMSDHFGLRETYIELNDKLRDELHLEGVNRASLEGREDWLFLSDAGLMKKDHNGTLRPETSDLKRWSEAIDNVASWSASKNITPVMLIAPNKQTIYPHFLPGHFGEQGTSRYRQQFVEAFETRPVKIIDPTELIERKAKEGQTYSKTDTHWTRYGAFFAAQMLVTHLIEKGFDLIPLENDQLFKAGVNTEFSGDLVRLRGTRPQQEQRAYFQVNGFDIKKTVLEDSDTEHLRTIILKGGPPDTPHLLIYGDSFSPMLGDILAHRFRRVTVVRRPRFDIDLEQLAPYKDAQIVLFEFVERTLWRDVKAVGVETIAD